MKPARFSYFRPTTLLEALSLIAEGEPDRKILAGGQSLVPAMNFRLARPDTLIDINGLTELANILPDGDRLRIGALARHATFHRPVIEGPLGLMLSRVVRHIAHYPIRQRGTFGGSLAHADPASEWCLVVTALGAEIIVQSVRGKRSISAESFFKGSFTTVLSEDEILTEVRLPVLPRGWRTGFYEFSRRAGDFALAMALAAVRIEDGTIRDVRLGIGGVSGRSIRMGAIEAFLTGKTPSSEVFDVAGAQARESINPTEDIHASADYRRDLIATVVKRALVQAVL